MRSRKNLKTSRENTKFSLKIIFDKKSYLYSCSLHEKCPNTEFFWFVFSRIWTEYGVVTSSRLLTGNFYWIISKVFRNGKVTIPTTY